MGGLSKKAFQMEKFRKENKEPWVAVDAGNLLFENGTVGQNEEKQEKITAVGIVTAYKQMSYDAAGIGIYDLAAGLPFLVELQKESSFPWLSANLVSASDNRPFFPPFLVFRRGGVTFGIIGITGEEVRTRLTQQGGAILLPWSKVLPPLAADLAKRCDFVILLSGLDSQANIDIARKVSGIDLIVEAGGSYGNKNPVLVGNTLITHSNKQGKHLGILQINWQPSKIWQKQDLRPLLTQKRALLDRANWQLKRIEAQGDPAVLFKNAPDRLLWYQRLVAQRDKVAAEVKELTAKVAARHETAKDSTFSASFIAMQTTLPDDPKVLAEVEKIKDDIAALGRKKASEKKTDAATGLLAGGDPSQKGYIGWKRCAGCHREITEKWQKTRHAKAYDSLAAKGQQFNQDCLPCHVTGVVTGKEPYILTLPEALLQVGCEACHGPGRAHAEDKSHHLQRPDKSVCRRCHTPDQDDNFVYEKKSLLVH